MHAEAHAGFGWALERSDLYPHNGPLRVLDIGGQDVNGTVHSYFPSATITTLDLENADIIADATTWEPDRLFDVVIATEVFEHVQDWPAVIATMAKALDPAGPGVLLATCASNNRQPHGATGAPAPAPGEWYLNVNPLVLHKVLRDHFRMVGVDYQYPPGDAYCWARRDPLLNVSVVIPTVGEARSTYLRDAVASVRDQTMVGHITIVEDNKHQGPAATRNIGIQAAKGDWIAFLDDDDWLLPTHLETLARAVVETGADVVWPWFTVHGGRDPFPTFRGRQWDPADPHQFPVTALVRKAALMAVGGFHTIEDGPTDKDGNRAGEDFDLWLRLSEAGYKFHHVPDQTWVWRHWGGNSSGLPSRIPWRT